MATKPTKPKILFVKRTDSSVQIRHEAMNTREQKVDVEKTKNQPAGAAPKTKEVQSSEEIDLTAHDAPLESFDKALQALGVVAAKQLDCDGDWAGKIEVVSLSVSYNERNVRTAVINFTKPLLQGTAIHPMKTPAFQIEDDKQGERRQCTENHGDRIIAVLKEAQRYVLGARGQGVLGFEDDEEDDDKIEQLPGMEKPGTQGED